MCENDEWIIAKLFVLQYLTTCMLSLWLSAAPSDEEVTARVEAIRTTVQDGIAQDGVAQLSDGIRSQASAFLAEMLDRVEHDIKKNRAAISAAPRVTQ